MSSILFGISVLVLLSLQSCNMISKVDQTGYLINSYNSHYLNSEEQFSFTTAGDFQLINKRKLAKKEIDSSKLIIKRIRIIDCLNTQQSKPFFSAFVLKAKSKKRFDFFLSKNNLMLDSNGVIFNAIGDFSFLGFTVINEKNEYLMFLATGKRDVTPWEEQLLGNEFKVVKNSINCGLKFIDAVTPNVHNEIRHAEKNPNGTLNYANPIVYLTTNKEWLSLDEWSYKQTFCTHASRISNFKPFERAFDEYNSGLKLKTIDLASIAINESALSTIIDLAKNESLVMFNENHFDVRHRILMRLLLQKLYDNGFKYFGLEAVFEEDSLLNQRKFPISTTGYYIAEPNFSNLIREAKEIGFHVFSYDYSNTNEGREEAQANNIFNKTFKKDSLAKVLIYGGYSHVYEEPIKGKSWMASIFKLKYNIDPLTFSQTNILIDTTVELALFKANNNTDFILNNNLTSKAIIKSQKLQTVVLNFPFEWNAKFRYNELLIGQVFSKEERDSTALSLPIINEFIVFEQKDIDLPLPSGKYSFVITSERGEDLWRTEFEVRE
ncbi:MAG: hypothetical protein ACI9G9_000084 [Psychromonas sp.]|jgi:hypothetical protein